MLPDKIYNALKVTAQYVLPGIASLYFGLSAIWNLPYPDQIVGTIMVVDTFLGALLGISLVQYNKTVQNNQYVQPSMPGLDEPKSKNIFTMSATTYDIFYWVVQVVLPAGGSLYFGLAQFWQLPYVNEFVATVALVDTFLGIFLGISTNKYNKSLSEIPA